MNQVATAPARNEVSNFHVDLDWLSLAEREDILEPGLPIIDTHHHLHDRPEGRYLVPDLEADIAQGHNVIGTVFVQGGNFFYWRSGPDIMRVVGETEIVVSMSASSKHLCNGIVGYADFLAGAAIAEVLDAHIEQGDGRFCGIRQTTIWDESDAVKYYQRPPFRPLSAGMLMDPRFREGFAELGKRSLAFDCTPYHTQLPEVIDLAKSFADTTIVLDHLGCIVQVGPYAGKNDEIFAFWKANLQKLAEQQNAVIKIGGLGMRMYGFDLRSRARPANSRELAELWKPYVETAIEIFGPDRAMFESNFPVDKGYFTYAACWNAFKRLTASASEAEKIDLYSGTAKRAYRLDL